jgi:hypothetical protein
MDYDTRQLCDDDPAGRDIGAPGHIAGVMCQ